MYQSTLYIYQDTVHRVKTWCKYTWDNQKSFDERSILQFLPEKLMTGKQITKDKNYKLQTIITTLVYNKSLSDSNWRENDYNGAYFYSNKILCVGWGGNTILFWITTNMTNYYLFYIKITIWEWIVQYFSSYLHDKHGIFASICW